VSFEEANTSLPKYKAALAEERENFSLLSRACKKLGCVPILLPSFDSENKPERNLTVAFLAYLASRLLDARQEINAARAIQAYWARSRMRKVASDTTAHKRARQIVASKWQKQHNEQMAIEKAKEDRARAALLLPRAPTGGSVQDSEELREKDIQITQVQPGLDVVSSTFAAEHERRRSRTTKKEENESSRAKHSESLRHQKVLMSEERRNRQARNEQRRNSCIQIQAVIRGFLARRSEVPLILNMDGNDDDTTIALSPLVKLETENKKETLAARKIQTFFHKYLVCCPL
jgi:hypothetical protein